MLFPIESKTLTVHVPAETPVTVKASTPFWGSPSRRNCQMKWRRARAGSSSRTPSTERSNPRRRRCSLADVAAANFLGGKIPEILEAIEFRPHGQDSIYSILFRGDVSIGPSDQILR